MIDHAANRIRVLKALRAELVGPSTEGTPIDCSEPLVFSRLEDAFGPFIERDSGEELLLRDPPCKRYGVGVLYPIGSVVEEPDDGPTDGEDSAVTENGMDDTADIDPDSDKRQRSLDSVENRAGISGDELDIDDFDLSIANSYRPSSMGVSFLVNLPPESKLVVEVPTNRSDGTKVNGRYEPLRVKVEGRDRIWWVRRPVYMRYEFSSEDLCRSSRGAMVAPLPSSKARTGPLKLNIEVFSRPFNGNRTRIITVCLVNRELAGRVSNHEASLFQAFFQVSVETEDDQQCILPYPVAPRSADATKEDMEELSLELLYRDFPTFAVGHGCAADWENDNPESAKYVTAECLPTFEAPSVTSVVERDDGSPVEISMVDLAGLNPQSIGLDALLEVIELYESWIQTKRDEIVNLSSHLQQIANEHMDKCSRVAAKMRQGLTYLQSDDLALRAFRLANHAILLQQVRSSPEPRKLQYDTRGTRVFLDPPFREIDETNPPAGRGKWRPFQIAFLLATICSVGVSGDPDRETVELIWFPTGGGKTEAYLGLAAFSMFMRRLRDPSDDGTEVLMRYTLRLLTAQQFQRAAGLICAMEYLRLRNPGELGSEPFSIGIWVGRSTTPNLRKQALDALKQLRRFPGSQNRFVVSRCPWCNAQIGPIKNSERYPRHAPKVVGYTQRGNTVAFHCSDPSCPFHGQLPIFVVDEDIYGNSPTMIIGTVDKFAMLPWRPEARSLFGIDEHGQRAKSPPGLIIQDELHLISGPLGSLVGLHEAVIEELCTDRRGPTVVRPKIVCSTATIRRYPEQVEALFARSNVNLFPPPGLEAADSFFNRFARRASGELEKGRMYVGVHAPGLGSLQTVQVRTLTSLLQAPVEFSAEEQDPWWTLLVFFNSLRELGTTVTLLQSDIPDYMKVLRNRLGLDYKSMRKFWNIKELTSRLRGDEVPDAIQDLQVPTTSNHAEPVDICLASNIIEVGVDIDRLSLMCVVGQPKSTSQYIQVTGRVGRNWRDRPGLVITIYGASKPRDRSHFEKFRSYHERLYAQVEPTSVTPFAPPVLDRALHAAMVAYARQVGNQAIATSPYPFPEELVGRIKRIFLKRAEIVDPDELENVQRVLNKRENEWRNWQPVNWDRQTAENPPLIREAGSYIVPEYEAVSWSTQMSMRNVDAECMAEIFMPFDRGETDERE